jgi:hypothetical protein
MAHCPVRFLYHFHLYQRDRSIQHGFQVGGHSVAIQREAPDTHVRVAIQIQNHVLVVVDDAVTVSACPTAETAPAGGYLLVNGIDDGHRVTSVGVQPFQKGFRQAEGVAFFLGASV